MAKVKSIYYTKPYEECAKNLKSNNLEVFKSLKAGKDSSYEVRDKTTKQVVSDGAFDSVVSATIYHGK